MYDDCQYDDSCFAYTINEQNEEGASGSAQKPENKISVSY